jgi:NarL family two-component system response regulator LiaR
LVTAKPIRLVIADDHRLVRQGIRAFLETCVDLAIVGEAGDASSAIEICGKQKPHVALVDLVMPGGGIAATRDIRAASPYTQVIVLTSFEDPQQILAAMQAGALSCLLKDVEPDDLADAVRKAARGETVIHPRLAERVIGALRAGATPTAALLNSLSQREGEVLALIAEGMNNQEIAGRLGVSDNTIKTHVSNVLVKLRVADRTQAAVLVWKTRLGNSELKR